MKMKAMKIGAVVLGYITVVAIFTLAEIWSVRCWNCRSDRHFLALD